MTNTLRVLLVEDSPTDAKLVVQALRGIGRTIEHHRVQDADAMRAALEAKTWDLVLSDWSMPKFSALAALAVLKESGIDIPFIIASGTIGEEAAIDAMRAGAHDYIFKDRLARLVPAIERELRESSDRALRRKAEAAVFASETRFRALVEHSENGILVSTASGVFTYASPAVAKILGRTVDEIIGTTFRDHVHADELETAAAYRQGVLAGDAHGPPRVRRVVRADGTVRWVEVTATNLLDDPAICGVVSNIHDITERKVAEGALVVAQHRYTALLESGVIGIMVAEVTGTIREANDTFLTMLGYWREDLQAGRLDWRTLTPPEWAAWNDDAGDKLRRTGRATPREKEYFRKDGTRVPVLVGIAQVDSPLTLSVSFDLSERKRMEHAKTNLEGQLRHAQKMEAVGRLAGGVAHDFNNVLTVILSYADLLIEDMTPSDPARLEVREIHKAGKRAADLTRQLLLFSRQQAIDPQLVDMNVLLADMGKMLRRILGEDVELIELTTNPIGAVRIDRSSLEAVVMNLVVNARDAMPTGGKLTIETTELELDESYARDRIGVEPGRYVMLAVSDTGVGMDRATQAKIFEPFFTTKEMGKGTGLGLSTVFGVVQQGGGHVWVYSEVGVGTTFKVYLPRADATPAPAHPTIAPATLRGNETILLVEDEDQVRAVAHDILARAGYDVIEARNGGEALLICEKHAGAIHLLLSDVVMPQMSGPELAKRLSAARPEMKVLCMSGYTDDSIVRHGVLEARFAFIQKPITPLTLTRKVREVLDAS